jgi:ParB family chromosome partitioning protein
MRNGVKLDLNKIRDNQQASSRTAPTAPAVSDLIQTVGSMKPGNTVSIPVCGREVVFTLQTVPREQVEKKTMVWGDNERRQELLTETALDDLIPSFISGGQLVPAFARDVNGVIEVADGSRRRKTAIYTGSDYRVLVGDLDDEQMAALSQTGNNYRQTSAYERGRRYARLLENVHDNNLSALAAAEKKDRKTILRCINTAKLPIEVIKLFAEPGELSARAGLELSAIHEKYTAEFMDRVEDFEAFRKAGEVLDTEMIIKVLKSVADDEKEPVKSKPTVRKFAEGITAKYDGENVNISLRGVAPELLQRIEMVLEAAGKPNGSAEVEEMFAELERKMQDK